MTSAEYIHSLPRKIVGSAAVFFNSKNELLIAKPNYRDGWLTPGGAVEALESPLQGCIREIKEEIGLDIPNLKCIGVGHEVGATPDGEKYDALQFTFYGGVLSDEQISNITLQKKELDEYRFVPLEEALKLLNQKLARRIDQALKAYNAGTIALRL